MNENNVFGLRQSLKTGLTYKYVQVAILKKSSIVVNQ
jgi:hypothetical protein